MPTTATITQKHREITENDQSTWTRTRTPRKSSKSTSTPPKSIQIGLPSSKSLLHRHPHDQEMPPAATIVEKHRETTENENNPVDHRRSGADDRSPASRNRNRQNSAVHAPNFLAGQHHTGLEMSTSSITS